ncbi:hypothetical protein [Streptomyces sp. NBC_01481]|uniref:hypothetical protein n=1 Tax=Streptomyces sp. NBC_01481 TaxID=2975869 RepID=UPI002255CD6B|nr:hypothetical protein [Streptomyces sp. NBC_01481]MCX4584564.1 hypothetical protein [Streptomyces sp. NBC_01481]
MNFVSLVTLLPLAVILSLPVIAIIVRRGTASRGRAHREIEFRNALPARSTSEGETDRLALGALDHLCSTSGSVPDVFVDMSGYFRQMAWNPADVHHIMGRLEDLGLARQQVTDHHPFNPGRYRATAVGVRENVANYGRRHAPSGVTIHQTSSSGDNHISGNFNSPGATSTTYQSHSEQGRVSYQELAQQLRNEADRAPQEQADVAASHADVLDAALADGDEQARDQAVGRIQRFLQTAGTGFEATQRLLSLINS